MKRNYKIILAVVMIVCGLALVGWNMRDPDAAFREPPKVETAMTIEKAPPAVQATIKRLATPGTKIEEIQEERRGDEIKYEVDIISGNMKTEYEISPEGKIVEQKSKKLKH